jgi:Peptidase family M23/LysM domain
MMLQRYTAMLQRYLIAAFLFFVFFSNGQAQNMDETLASAALLSPILKKNKKENKKERDNNTAPTEELNEEPTAETFEHGLWDNLLCEQFEKYFGFSAICDPILPVAPTPVAPLTDCDDDKVWISDSVSIDSKWFFGSNHYNIWDTHSVNPYNFDLKTLPDSVPLELFSENTLKNWSTPLYKTKSNSDFGMRRYRWHHGIDLDLEIGDSIFASFDGVVRMARYNYRGYGYYVLIRHENGLETLYGHLTKFLVKPGDVVKAGDLIGLGGNTGRSTGPHLHFEMRYKGHAFNPEAVFDFERDTIKCQNFTLTKTHYQDQLNRLKSEFYRVRSGDNLGKISAKFGTPIPTLCRMNGISRKTSLRPGRSLRVK